MRGRDYRFPGAGTAPNTNRPISRSSFTLIPPGQTPKGDPCPAPACGAVTAPAAPQRPAQAGAQGRQTLRALGRAARIRDVPGDTLVPNPPPSRADPAVFWCGTREYLALPEGYRHSAGRSRALYQSPPWAKTGSSALRCLYQGATGPRLRASNPKPPFAKARGNVE